MATLKKIPIKQLTFNHISIKKTNFQGRVKNIFSKLGIFGQNLVA